MRRIIFIQFDHLNQSYGALKTADPKQDLILFVESARAKRDPKWHKTRLYFLISSARHFAADLEKAGFTVLYHFAETVMGGIKEIKAKPEYANLPIISCEPSSFRLTKFLSSIGIEFVANDFFLTPRELFRNWASNQKSYLMETFYRSQRIRLNILVDGNKPVGGAWNFDKENRLTPPKNYTYPEYLTHSRDQIDNEVLQELKSSNLDLWGADPDSTWATTRAGALAQLENFLNNHFENFGPYEDAMVKENWAFHHSLLSPYLNIGLIHANEVLEAVRNRYLKGDIPLASCEGFVRQVIGWREYINGVYWFFGEKYREQNHFELSRPLLPLFTDTSKTHMSCISQQIADIHDRAWVHHIPRLMVLSNLALLAGIEPIQYLNWMREMFIDASDWVMVPNVIGMGMHSDGGLMMTKPYVSGGSYISKMSNYCKGCKYNPKLRTGPDACPFTNLYWNFLAEHQDEFKGNHRMFQQMSGLKRLSDLEEVRKESARILKGLSDGTI